MNATLNFRVPLGAAPARHKKASYGLTFGYNHRLDGMTDDGRIATHQTKLADFRFTGGLKLWKAEVASYDLANLDKDPRLNMGPDDGKDSTTWIIIGLVVAGVAVCVAAECIGGYDDDDDDNGSDGGSGSGPY